MIKAVPLLVLPVLAYVVVVMLGGTIALSRPLFTFGLPSGATYAFDAGTAILAFGVFMLLIEVMKSTNVKSTNSILDHALSTVLLIVCILIFVLMPTGGTSTFLLLMLLCFIDVIAGFTVSIKTAQRDFQVDKTFQ
jgi:hypothetical protein